MPNTPPPPTPSPPVPRQNAILHGIRVTTAHRDEIILDGINLEIRPGEFVGIAGETGSGKTTTGMLLLGYLRTGLRLRNGSARIGDQEMLGRSDRELKRLRGVRAAYAPQHPPPPPHPRCP